MKGALMLAGLLAVGVTLAAVQTKLIKENVKNISDNLVYGICVYTIGSIVMVLSGGRLSCSPYVRILGIITGCLIIVESMTGVSALRHGSLALTTLVTMSNMILTIIPAGLLWNEPMSLKRAAGVILMLLSMALVLNVFGKKEENSNISGKWVVIVFVCFVAGGLVGFPQKYLTVSPYAGEVMSYLLWAYLVEACLESVMLILNINVRKESVTMAANRENILRLAASAVLTSLLHILTMGALRELPISVVMPISNGGRLILITLMDVVYFKSDLSRQQIAGILTGVAAIVVLSI